MLRIFSIEPEIEPTGTPSQEVHHPAPANPRPVRGLRELRLVAPALRAPDAPAVESADLILRTPAPDQRSADQRRGAERQTRGQVPWLSRIKLPWGLDLELLNISTSGILVETTAKFTPGSRTEFHLLGPDTELVVPGRFVRTEVAAVDPRCVKYYAAAAFEKPLNLLRPGAEPVGAPSKLEALGALLTRVLADLNRGGDPEALRTALEHGLSELVPARAIEIREAPIEPGPGGESIYFNVPAGSVPRAVLQVTFDPDCGPSETDFRILKAAALLTAAVLEFDPRAL